MGKVLILYSTAGIGHKKAALAVKEAFDRSARGDEAVLQDALDYTNNFFRISYGAIYLFLVKYLPTLWGFFYYILDNPIVYALVRPLRRLNNYLNSKKLVEFLLTMKPKTVIVTHFFPSEVVDNLKKKGLLDTRLISVITDYRSHLFWLSKYVDIYIAGSDYTKDDLLRRGVPEERIKVFGIPCASSFSREHQRSAICRKAGLEPGKKTIFILGGGFGVGPIKGITLSLDKAKEDFQAIVVCGYNAKLYNAVKKAARSASHRFRVFGFVDNIDELMAVSDVLVSKSGGITVSEALNANLPMIVVSPIPGQEMRNYDFLKKNHAAAKIKCPGDIVRVARELFDTDKLETLKRNVKKIRLVSSAERIMHETND